MYTKRKVTINSQGLLYIKTRKIELHSHSYYIYVQPAILTEVITYIETFLPLWGSKSFLFTINCDYSHSNTHSEYFTYRYFHSRGSLIADKVTVWIGNLKTIIIYKKFYNY